MSDNQITTYESRNFGEVKLGEGTIAVARTILLGCDPVNHPVNFVTQARAYGMRLKAHEVLSNPYTFWFLIEDALDLLGLTDYASDYWPSISQG